MKNKTVGIILSLAVLLLAFIVFLEKGTMSTSELDKRQNHVFVDYESNEVERFEIKNTTGKAVEVTASEDGVTGQRKWSISSPAPLDADPSEVQTILSAIDYILKERTVQGSEKIEDPKFGFDHPRVSVSFTAGGVTNSFRIGGDAPGDKVYLVVDRTADEFYAVDKEFYESMNKTRDDLRSKKLVAPSLQNSKRIEIIRPRSRILLTRDEYAPWQIAVDGTTILADNSQVNELLQTVGDLRASRFIADGLPKENLGQYGLSNPTASIAVHLHKGSPIAVLVGNPCTEQKHHRYMTVAETGTVMCVKDNFMPIIERPISRMKETRPAVFEDDEITGMTIVKDGRTLHINKKEGVWTIAGQDSPPVEQAAADELLHLLRETRTSKIVVGDRAIGQLGKPSAHITLDRNDNRNNIELALFYDAKNGSLQLRRSNESAVLTLPIEINDQISSDALAFRTRKIARGNMHDVEQLHIESAVTQKLHKREGLWSLTEPLDIAADGDAARRLAELMTNITVVRYVSMEARAAHGFANPFAIITATVAVETLDGTGQKDQTGSNRIVLQIGAPADGTGRFARLPGADSPVFVIGQEYEEAIQNPFVARDLMQVDDTDLSQLTLVHAGTEVVLKKSGNTWTTSNKSKIDRVRLQQILADLSAMKIVRAYAFGSTHAYYGKPTLIIKAVGFGDSEKETVITVGPKSADAQENGYLAGVNGLEVIFVVPARIIEELIAIAAGS
jgi:hypothetical protein